MLRLLLALSTADALLLLAPRVLASRRAGLASMTLEISPPDGFVWGVNLDEGSLPPPSPPPSAALLFDCDGVLVETEELHRVAYNMAFEEFGLQIAGAPVVWSKEYYSFLANTVGGGKPKMRCASRRAPRRRRSLHLPGASPSLSSCADHFTGLGAPEGARTHQDTAKVRDEWSL